MKRTYIHLVGASLILVGCGTTPPEQAAERPREAKLALSAGDDSAQAVVTQSPASPAAASNYRRSRKDPNANQYPTGARLPSAEEQSRAQNKTQKILEIRPTALAVERVQKELNQKGGVALGSSPATDSVTTTEQAPAGAELTTVPAQATGALVGSQTAAPASLPATVTVTGTYPSAVNNSSLPAFPEVRSQGGLGSCVCFAVGYYQYTYELGTLAGWNNKNSVDTTKVSPRWLYNLINNGYDGGSWDGDALEILAEQGALTWADFPYIDNGTDPIAYRQWPTGAATWEKALKYKALQYGTLATPNTSDAIAAVKAMLANGHVLTFQTYVYTWEFDTEGVGNDPSTTADDAFVGQAVATWVNGYDGSHEMTIVGYNDNIWVDINDNGIVEPSEKGAFKIANSWGDWWQNGGYAWLHYDAMYDVSQVPAGPSSFMRHAATGSLNWVTARANYQPDLVAEFTASTISRGSMMLRAGRAEYDATQAFDDTDFRAFRMNGGSFAWDGTQTTTPQQASFAIDLTNLASSYNDLRYLWHGTDYSSTPGKLSGLTLVDRLQSNKRTVTTDPAVTLNGNSASGQGVRYKFTDPSKVAHMTSTISNYAFGSVGLGTVGTKVAQLKNTGTGDLLVTSLSKSNVLYSVDPNAPLTIHPGQTQNLTVGFAPAATQTESTNLILRSNDSSVPKATYAMSGTGTSTFGSAPMKVYVLQESNPLDNIIGMRFSIVNTSAATIPIADHRLIYYYYDPYQDQSQMVWDTYYTTVSGTIGSDVRKIYTTQSAGIRKADTALDITFPAGTVINPGQTLIVEGKLHDPTWNLTFDENDDWSWYERADKLAENVVIQHKTSKAISFGSSPEGVFTGATMMAISPNPVGSQATVTFRLDDASLVGSTVYLDLYVYGWRQQSIPYRVMAAGAQTYNLNMSGYWTSNYTLTLKVKNVVVDYVDFQKL